MNNHSETGSITPKASNPTITRYVIVAKKKKAVPREYFYKPI